MESGWDGPVKGPGPYRTRIGATSMVVWFAFISDTEMLRGKNGVGRAFRSREAAEEAIVRYMKSLPIVVQ